MMENKSEISRILVTGLVAVASVVMAVFLMRLTGPLPLSVSQTTTNKLGSFDVTGSAEMVTTPDKAEVSLGISQQGASVKEVQDKANQVLKTITDGLTRLGIDKADIKTVNYSINPNYDFSDGKQRINGYMISANLMVTTDDFDLLNQVIDLGTASGANQVGGVNFIVSDLKMKEIRTQARKEAIGDAKKNAEELASLAGMRLGRIINILENQATPPRPIQMMALDAAKSEAAAGTQVEPGTTTIQYMVTVSYETL